jgi:hypothetical protein
VDLIAGITITIAALVGLGLIMVMLVVMLHYDSFDYHHNRPQTGVARLEPLNELERVLRQEKREDDTTSLLAALPAWAAQHAPVVCCHPEEPYLPVAMEDLLNLCFLYDRHEQRSFSLRRPKSAHKKDLLAWVSGPVPEDLRATLAGEPVTVGGRAMIRRRRTARYQIALERRRISNEFPTHSVKGHAHPDGSPNYPHAPRMTARIVRVTVGDQTFLDTYYEWFHAMREGAQLTPGGGLAMLDVPLVVRRVTWPDLVEVGFFLSTGTDTGGWWHADALVHRGSRPVVYAARGTHALYPHASRWTRCHGLADDLTADGGVVVTMHTTVVPDPTDTDDRETILALADDTTTPAWWHFPGVYSRTLVPGAAFAQGIVRNLHAPLLDGYTVDPGNAAVAARLLPGTPLLEIDKRLPPWSDTPLREYAATPPVPPAPLAPSVGNLVRRVDWQNEVGTWLRARLLASLSGHPCPMPPPIRWHHVTSPGITLDIHLTGVTGLKVDAVESPAPRHLYLLMRPGTVAFQGELIWHDPHAGTTLNETFTLHAEMVRATVPLLVELPLHATATGDWFVPYRWKGAGPPHLGRVPYFDLQVLDTDLVMDLSQPTLNVQPGTGTLATQVTDARNALTAQLTDASALKVLRQHWAATMATWLARIRDGQW